MKDFIKNTPLENLFVIIAFFFGLLYVFILPPFQSVDENYHFYRTYQISTGKFISQKISPSANLINENSRVGDELPDSLSNYYNLYAPLIKNIDKKQTLENLKRDYNIHLEPENKRFTAFANTSLYSPVCYISQLPGVILGKLLTDRLAVIYYLGRICNLIVYCILIYWAIRLIPFYKLPLFLLALMPMSLSLAASYTCDVAVFGLNFLWIALILKFIAADNNSTNLKVKNRIIFGLIILSFLITLTKSYILLIPLCFLIPINSFNNKKHYLIGLSCIIAAALFSGYIWYSASHGLTLNMNDTVANSTGQIEFIKSHPIAYIGILLKTFIIKTPRLIITMIGVLGWQDTVLDWSTYILYPILTYFAICSDGFKFELQRQQKYFIALILLIGVVLTYTSLYIMWSPVGNDVILGLNGKYFIPMMLPLFLMFKPQNARYDYNQTVYAVVLLLILILFTSELSLLHRFYDITPQLYYKI